MSSVPGSAISIADGEITIDAELLASKLGLSVASLKAEMRNGDAQGHCLQRRRNRHQRGRRTHTSYF